ncbi:acyl-CoA dehydrogenase family protein [Arthrobacter sp. H35-D1]|uniref:acyl-CoA dehydrogenase family protein n=1 Tax=Arthrobacter sp. H35-D1 TaxID=3046202 RepID=UPI0024B9FE64|nr:acyl-CoA dehydrogenase family protein [Arthrobacter sp. H35-D1]MDJ0311743.1 acyl-CoA dehydrogenase family protein [Arthrobacter sp. H35-D1]
MNHTPPPAGGPAGTSAGTSPGTPAGLYPDAVEDLRQRTRGFIRGTVIPAEPRPGQALNLAVRRELSAAAREAGVFAPHVSVEFGGQGLAVEHWSPVFQEAGYSPIGAAVLNCMAPDEGNMHMLDLIGTPEQKRRFLAPLAAGDISSCFAMSEPHPGAGSDPSALTTNAVREGSGWRISGDKRFTSGATFAGFAIVMARTEPAGSGGPEGTAGASQKPRPHAATMFLVPMDTPGVRIGAPIHTVDKYLPGGHPHVHFDDVHVPGSAVLGEAGLGFKYAQVRLGPARLTHCMRWLGLARRAMDIMLDRTNTREIFGAHLSQLGIAQEMIAQSVIDLETSDAIIAKCAALLTVDPKAGSALSSVAKVHCSEAVYRVIDRAVQLCGGDGVSDGLPLIQYLNEVRPFRIYDGSTETHKWAIARRAASGRRHAVESGEPFQGTARTHEGEP